MVHSPSSFENKYVWFIHQVANWTSFLSGRLMKPEVSMEVITTEADETVYIKRL